MGGQHTSEITRYKINNYQWKNVESRNEIELDSTSLDSTPKLYLEYLKSNGKIGIFTRSLKRDSKDSALLYWILRNEDNAPIRYKYSSYSDWKTVNNDGITEPILVKKGESEKIEYQYRDSGGSWGESYYP